MFLEWTVDLVASLALALYAFFFAVVLLGLIIVWRGQKRRRWNGWLIALAGLIPAALLVLMSTKYWIERHQIIAVPIKQLGITIASVLVPFGLGIALAIGLGYWLVRQVNARSWFTSVGGILVVTVVVAVIGTMQLITLTQNAQPKVYTPQVTNVRIEKGFTLDLFSQGTFNLPTSLRFGPDGQLYVSDYNGDIWAIPTKDGVAGKPHLFAERFVEPVGMAWRGNELYVASHGKISILRDSQGVGRADSVRDIITDLPSRVYDWHSNYGMAFGPDGRLYFPLGATSDSSPETQKYAASILSANPDGSDLRVFATGVRNPYSVAFNSKGDLFATDNGPDTFTVTPSDKLMYIVQGADYGFPKYFDIPPVGSGTHGPLAMFPPHASADGLAIYNASQFPSEYSDNAFVVTFHRGEVYRVQLAKGANGDYLANTSMFANGLDHPVDITVGPDGNLYIADWGDSAIYRVSYTAQSTTSR